MTRTGRPPIEKGERLITITVTLLPRHVETLIAASVSNRKRGQRPNLSATVRAMIDNLQRGDAGK